MITDKFIKGYAVLKSNWLSTNILEEYIPFLATIIIEDKIQEVNENLLCRKLKQKYGICFQPTFVRQVLSCAVSKNIILKVQERFVPNPDIINDYRINFNNFNKEFNLLLKDFLEFSKKQNYYMQAKTAQKKIYDFIDKYDDKVIYDNIDDLDIKDNKFMIVWCDYILQLKDSKPNLYEFVLGLCSANLIKTALFYTNEVKQEKVDLTVYIDTPMIFGLLGMDTVERTEEYAYLINKAKSVGMKICVFEHNLQEAKGIMENASRWAMSENYTLSSANKVAQFFHDSKMLEHEASEFIFDTAAKLNTLGISIDDALYLTEENAFQIDEEKLFNSIKQEYALRSLNFDLEEKNNSIRTDVRSLVMTTRKRANNYSADLRSCRYIFITTNSVVAKVSKDFMCSENTTESRIPSCITANIFGTLLWLDFPEEKQQYNNCKLIADCKALRNASPEMLDRFNRELEAAYERGDAELTQGKFLFLRSHPIVKSVLLNVTSGDYSQFTSKTWSEVYDTIVSKAQFEGNKKYEDEKIGHEKTIEKLAVATNNFNSMLQQKEEWEEKYHTQNESFAKFKAHIFSVLIFIIPFIVSTLLTIFVESEIFEWTFRGITLALICAVITTLMGVCYNKLHKRLTKYFLNKDK